MDSPILRKGWTVWPAQKAVAPARRWLASVLLTGDQTQELQPAPEPSLSRGPIMLPNDGEAVSWLAEKFDAKLKQNRTRSICDVGRSRCLDYTRVICAVF